VIRRRVRFAATARSQLRSLEEWWQSNSPRPHILHQDLEEAVNLLSAFPGIGSPYGRSPIPGVRRLYLERLTSHIYYTYDDQEVVIRSLWHARRGSGPDFGTFG
jgi:plasmid stabilization system protein ParE